MGPTTFTGTDKKIACTVCGDIKTRRERLNGLNLYICPSCRHRYTDPSSIATMEEYGADYYDEKHRKWFENPDIALFEFVRRQLSTLGPGASVLDVGCGNGAFLRYLRSRSPGLKLTGIDYRANDSTDGIEFIQGDIFDASFAREFDVVVNLAVIEHVWDVQRFARRIADLCTPGGMTVTMTVNDGSLIYGASRLAAKMGISVAMKRLYEKHHVNHFSKSSLQRLFQNAGLEVLIEYSHVPPLAAIDTPAGNRATKLAYVAALSVLLMVEKLTGRTILQTLIAKRPLLSEGAVLLSRENAQL